MEDRIDRLLSQWESSLKWVRSELQLEYLPESERKYLEGQRDILQDGVSDLKYVVGTPVQDVAYDFNVEWMVDGDIVCAPMMRAMPMSEVEREGRYQAALGILRRDSNGEEVNRSLSS